jgi:hypothetical protein
LTAADQDRLSDRSDIGHPFASNWLYYGPSVFKEINAQESRTGDFKGQSVCITAVESRTLCGSVRTTDSTFTYAADGITLYNQRTASFATIPGDSGGGWFRNSTPAKAVGAHSGNTSGSPQFAIYSHIGWMDYYYPSLVGQQRLAAVGGPVDDGAATERFR